MKTAITIEIKSAPEKIFSWLEDPTRAREWMTSVSKTEIIKQVSGMVGTTFREFVEEDGRGTEMRGVVTDFVSNKRLAFHLEGDYNTVDVSYTLEENGKLTRLSQIAEIRFKGLVRIFSIFFGPLFKRKIIKQAQREFAKLKELCERAG
jgi:uncharacterized protein YndB with AHSA1/START domain